MVREVNSITCTCWVPCGAAKRHPDKVTVETEVLQALIEESKDKGDDENETLSEDKYEALEVKALEEDLKVNNSKYEESKSIEKLDSMENEEEESIEKLYKLDTYEEDSDETLMKLGRLTVHAQSVDDPHITVKEDDEISEIENYEILPSDNLITAGHVDGESFILEVYVYNSEEESLYVHHDTLLPAVPYCMQWLDFDPEDEQLSPGNLLAIGYHSPVIEVWDLNMTDTIEPAFTLGKKGSKKKKIPAYGHSDAVLCLGWNKELSHIFASGSVDKTVKLWDLQECKVAQNVDTFKGIISDLKWDTTGKQLITGCEDKFLRLHDFSSDSVKAWLLDGEVDCISWGNCQQTNNIYASTDKGTLYGFDKRQTEPLFQVAAHSQSCTGLLFSATCPGCLVTTSDDETLKIWDVLGDKPQLVEERNPRLGVLHTLSMCPDLPFVVCLGGDNKENNFKVWDMRQSLKVRKQFCERIGLAVDLERNEEDESVNLLEDEQEYMDYQNDFSKLIGGAAAAAPSNQTKWKPSQKSKKQKGGHLDKKKKRQ